MFELVADEQSVKIREGAVELGSICYRLRYKKQLLRPRNIRTEKSEIVVDFGPANLNDRITGTAEGLRIERTWTLCRPGSWQLLFEYRPALPRDSEWIVPAIMYQKNASGTGNFPRGGLEPGWSFREDRIPLPSCSILIDRDHRYQALYCSPAQKEEELSSVKSGLDRQGVFLEIRIPYTEEPKTYWEKGIFFGGLGRATGKRLRLHLRQLPFTYRRRFTLVRGQYKAYSTEVYRTVTASAFRQGAVESKPVVLPRSLLRTTTWISTARSSGSTCSGSGKRAVGPVGGIMPSP